MNKRQTGTLLLGCLAVSLLYGWTTASSILLEDDGYFITAGFFAGAAHPPGYPTFILLLNTVMYLPWGSIAWKAHFASALCATVSCLLLTLCILHITRSIAAGLLAAAALAVSPIFWSQAQIADVYTLNVAIFLGLFYLSLQLEHARPAAQIRLLYAIALLTGIGLANHWPLLVMASPGIVWLVWPHWRIALRHLFGLTVCLAIGLLPYLWMVWRTQQPIPFLFIGSIDSLEEFRRYVLREYYSVDSSSTATWVDRWQFIRFFLQSWTNQLTLPGWLLAMMGLAHGLRHHPRITQASLLSFLITAGLLLSVIHFNYDHLWRDVFSVYPLIPYALTALWLGIGLHAVLQKFPTRRIFILIASMAMITATGIWRWPDHNLHNFDETARYADALLSPLPKNSIVVTEGDVNTAVLGYYHLVDGLRPDITLITRHGTLFNTTLLPLKLDRQSIKERINALTEAQPEQVFFTDSYSRNPSRHWQNQGLAGTLRDDTNLPPAFIPKHMAYLERLLLTDIDYPYYWWDMHQQTMRQRLCYLVGRYHRYPEAFTDYKNLLKHCGQSFEGLVGFSEGRLLSGEHFSPTAMLHNGQLAASRLPPLARRKQKVSALNIQSYALLGLGDYAKAKQLAEQSLAQQPGKNNAAHQYKQYANEKLIEKSRMVVPERGIEPPTY